MNIAVIAWGSLIWSPRNLGLRALWHRDGPKLTLEFTRISRGGLLTLCLDDSAPPQTSLWALADRDMVEDATENLRHRERAPSVVDIGAWRRGDGAEDSVTKAVADWAEGREVDAAIWTALPRRDPPFTADEAVQFVRDMHMVDQQRAREYFENAPAQVQTPLRARFRDEFGWKDAALPEDLFAA